jgi:Fe-Mn family superoxide dismutase
MEKYSLPDLGYDYSALEPHYSARTLELHHSKHHAAYVSGANNALATLAAARADGEFDTINQMQKSLAFHVSGHVLHSLLWRNLSPHGGGEAEGELLAAIDEYFGMFAALRSQITAAAVNVQGPVGGDRVGAVGNAWWSSRSTIIRQHRHGTVPLLVLACGSTPITCNTKT